MYLVAFRHMTLSSHYLPMQTHHNHNFRATLSNFFGQCEEVHSKLHSIILTLLQ